MAEQLHAEMAQGPISLARIVRILLEKWKKDLGISLFAEEVARCLLGYEDVETGDLVDGRFVSWNLDPWDADDKIRQKLETSSGLFEDETSCVFRLR